MKTLSSLLCGLLLLASNVGAFAATLPPATPAKPAAPAPAAKPEEKPASSPSPLDDCIEEMAKVFPLSDAEKKQIHDLYAADAAAIEKIGSDSSLSPLQKAQEIVDLREVRNVKIEVILHDLDRKKAFEEVEAIHRVGMTELALDGKLVALAVPVPAAAPAPASTNAAPAAPAPAK